MDVRTLAQSNWLVALEENAMTEEIREEYKVILTTEEDFNYTLKYLISEIAGKFFEDKIDKDSAIMFIENEYKYYNLEKYFGDFQKIKEYLSFVFDEYTNIESKRQFILNCVEFLKNEENEEIKTGAYFAILRFALSADFVKENIKIIKELNGYLNNKKGYNNEYNPYYDVIYQAFFNMRNKF